MAEQTGPGSTAAAQITFGSSAVLTFYFSAVQFNRYQLVFNVFTGVMKSPNKLMPVILEEYKE